jgi:hypothetical protein
VVGTGIGAINRAWVAGHPGAVGAHEHVGDLVSVRRENPCGQAGG